MDVGSVRDAYSSRSQQYIGLFDGGLDADDADATLIRRHLAVDTGPVLDLGCGPGHWTADLHRRGVQVTGIDIVPEFIRHARAHHPGPEFRLDSMASLDFAAGSVAGILSWFSTIHLPPSDLDGALAEFRRLLSPSGILVLGFFDSDDEVAAFDHAVHTAYRWPCDRMVQRVTDVGFVEVERLQRQLAERPDRKYAAVALRAV